MRFQVPQFTDIEDKIIGPFTLKQFLVYVGAVLLLIPLYVAFDLSLFVTLAIPVMGIAALFAHFRLHGKSLFAVASNALKFAASGQQFIWRRTGTSKPLKIAGDEFGNFTDFAGNQILTPGQLSSLSARAASLETAGNVSQEDSADPLTNEE